MSACQAKGEERVECRKLEETERTGEVRSGEDRKGKEGDGSSCGIMNIKRGSAREKTCKWMKMKHR